MDNTTFYLRVADFIIKFEFYPSSLKLVEKLLIKKFIKIYEGFLINNFQGEKIDFVIAMKDKTEMDLLISRKKNTVYKYLNLYKREGLHVTTYYYINLIQLRHILREVLQILLTKNHGFQLHASGSIIKGNAVLFVGAHAAGKSTAAKLAKKTFTNLADDSIAIRLINGQFYAYHTFEYEKNYVAKNKRGYPIKAVNFLYKSKDTTIQQIVKKDIVTKLLLKEYWAMDKNFFTQQSKIMLKFINADIIFNKLFFSLNSKKFTTLLRKFEL